MPCARLPISPVFPTAFYGPLSARLLPVTPMEETGLVDREQLLDIQGRSRKRQQALAEAWGYSSYPPSAGGCLLTEEGFSTSYATCSTTIRRRPWPMSSC